MDFTETGDHTNSSWFASAIDGSLDPETEDNQASNQEENDNNEDDE